jgi:hypothetical protein
MVQGDEGMWLFTDLPREHLKNVHGFEPSAEWAEHVRLSSVRFNSGGSASFVSSNGLVITNHHVAADTLHKLSTAERDIAGDGFLAASKQEELKAPDLELNQLVSIEDVTARVNEAVKSDADTADAFKARRAVMAEIEKESLDQTGFRSDVITLYGGARYHLYRYKKYTDVRLVWAPESAVAAFGGDPDNFEYPRYCLDATIFRVYEDGKPAQIEHFLKWSERGAQAGDLVFVSGNPGRTQRIFTSAALKYLRDKRLPYVMNLLRRREIMLQQFGLEGIEQERRAKDEMQGVQNGRKAYTGMIQGLQNPAFIALKEKQEQEFLNRLAATEHSELASAWDTIAANQAAEAELLGQTASFRSRYFDIAQKLVLMAAEDQKPSAERLREYRDSARASLEQGLYSPAPIYDDLETEKMADSLAQFIETRGADDAWSVKVLEGNSPRVRAAAMVEASQLQDVAVRKSLAAGGPSAIEASNDPFIQLARNMEPEFRRLRTIRDELAETTRQAYAKITAAKVALEGATGYPDATFTLRLAFGVVKGYEENGKRVPPFTTVQGAFDHELAHRQKEPWVLPPAWHAAKEAMANETPFNFVCTADIIGGNSGSPVINRDGEFVGIIFDGNIHSLTADYFYSDELGRATSVHCRVIRESLRNVYGAADLADELGR